MLDCLCFRDLINMDAKERGRFDAELTVPVNLLLFWGASIGGAAATRVEGRMPANVMRGIGGSDSSRGSMEW